MLNFSWMEILLIGAIALIVIGPKELPGTLRTIGRMIGKVRRLASDFQGQFNEALREADLDHVRKDLDTPPPARPRALRGGVAGGGGGHPPKKTPPPGGSAPAPPAPGAGGGRARWGGRRRGRGGGAAGAGGGRAAGGGAGGGGPGGAPPRGAGRREGGGGTGAGGRGRGAGPPTPPSPGGARPDPEAGTKPGPQGDPPAPPPGGGQPGGGRGGGGKPPPTPPQRTPEGKRAKRDDACGRGRDRSVPRASHRTSHRAASAPDPGDDRLRGDVRPLLHLRAHDLQHPRPALCAGARHAGRGADDLHARAGIFLHPAAGRLLRRRLPRFSLCRDADLQVHRAGAL